MKARTAERGGSIAETAIVMMLALIVIFGIMEFGRVLYTYHAVSNAARLGTRYAIVRGSGCAVAGCPVTASALQTYVRGLTPLTDPSSMTVATHWTGTDYKRNTCDDTTHYAGCLVSVQVQYSFTFWIPLVATPPITLASTSKMVVSQ